MYFHTFCALTDNMLTYQPTKSTVLLRSEHVKGPKIRLQRLSLKDRISNSPKFQLTKLWHTRQTVNIMNTLVVLLALAVCAFGDTGKFVLLSDIHYAPEVGSVTNPAFADIQYGLDSPFYLLNSTVQALVNAIPNPDFVLIAGDMHSHSLSGYNSTYAFTYSNQVSQDIE
jgi:hypothetical protein